MFIYGNQAHYFKYRGLYMSVFNPQKLSVKLIPPTTFAHQLKEENILSRIQILQQNYF